MVHGNSFNGLGGLSHYQGDGAERTWPSGKDRPLLESQLHRLLACGLGKLPNLSELQFLQLGYGKVVRIQWNNVAKVWGHSRYERNCSLLPMKAATFS